MIIYTLKCNMFYQRRLGDYTGMHCGQAHFVTYYRFLGSARHCSVAFAEVRTGELFQYYN